MGSARACTGGGKSSRLVQRYSCFSSMINYIQGMDHNHHHYFYSESSFPFFSMLPLPSLPLSLQSMFRNQKVKEQVVIIGGGRGKGDPQQVRVIKGAQLQTYRSKGRQWSSTLTQIVSQEGSIAIVDKNREAWLIGEPFPSPVNISSLLRRKIDRVFLGEKEMIVESKGEFILLNWGSVKALSGRQLQRVSTFSSNESEALLLAYLIPQVQAGVTFHYSLQKKVENSNRLYQIRPEECEIMAHPTLTSIRTIRPVRGVSVGRHHALCWDSQGELFSWGCRSLGLGFGSLPTEDIIQTPSRVKLGKHVLMAFAATHYSLALTSEGVLYEWGIKPEYNQINEEPIFQPRPLDFRFFRCRARFVAVKGREDNFAALASTGQLYVWGLSARGLLSRDIQLPAAWRGSHVYEPVLQTDFLPHRVRDFSVEVASLSVILTSGDEEPEEEYWQVLKEKAKIQLSCFKGNRVRTDASESLAKLRTKYRNPLLGDPFPATERVQQSSQAKSAPKTPTERRIREKHESLVNLKSAASFKKTAPLSNTYWPVPVTPNSHKRQVSDFFGSASPMEGMGLRCSQMGLRREQSKKFSEAYSIRLQGVLQKKQKLENMSLVNNLKRIDEGDVEYKLRKKHEEQVRKRREAQESTLKRVLLPFLTKTYLIKLLTGPLDAGREALIASFSRSLVFVRVQKNIKRLFVDAKIKFSMLALQKDRFPRYALLAMYFKNYVVRFRQRRAKNLRMKAIQSIVTHVAKEKIRVGMGMLAMPVGRIGRLGHWLKRFNMERLRLLRELWNNFVLVTLKPSDGGQINLHASPEATFAQRYQQALEGRRIGGLDANYRGAVRMGEPRITNKKTLSELKRRANLRFAQQFRLSSTQILPYSLHYNALRRPKHLDIGLADSLRGSACWIQVQRRTLTDHLKGILAKQDRQFYLRRRDYELELANYLQSRYDTFYQLRWKFIIEYNKVERTAQKRRKEKRLRRLLSLVGMQRLFDQDCIPQKSLVLEQALRRRDAPKPPLPVLHFDLQTFEESFKLYWETLYAKAKQIRKRNS